MNALVNKFNKIKPDILSGISTATIALPQNMAYALIIGINPIYGIYASIFSMLVATLFNKSNYIIVGPTNMMAVALFSSLSSFQGNNYLQIIFFTTFLIGLFQFLLVQFNLSELVKYVSHPVVVALSNGAAILIIFSQIKNFTGIDVTGSNVLIKFYDFVTNIGNLNFYNLTIGITTLLLIYIINKFKPKLPEYLLAVVIVSLFTYITGIYENIPLVGEIPKRIIDFNIFTFNLDIFYSIYAKAFSIALLGLIQTMAVLQAVSLKKKEKVDFKKNFKSQGITNMFISFFSGFAISASFSNTFANISAGAKTKLSQLFCSISIIVFILFLRPLIKYIPVSVLAGLVIAAAFGIFDLEEIKLNMKSTKGDAIMFWSTFLATIILPNLDQAIYIGVLVSLVVVIQISNKANIDMLYYDKRKDEKGYHLHHAEYDDSEFEINAQKARVIDLKGAIHFSAADDLTQQLNEFYEPDIDFIIRIRNVSRIDITIINVLNEFIDKVQKNGSFVMFTGVNDDIKVIFDQQGITEKVGKSNIYPPESKYFAATRKAIDFSHEQINNDQ